ncbi:hypothetical protein PoB_003962200 [Plakobranchus ocellatus]|uniref:Uncharacterized protein n=1 Tax=Plakobranchus ocellatus TaxID=259542 RepID=A0AAV4B0S1_9GAST|nr:hypothetical protein PoB_003962200 [Plakobranchus ocellatus]
MGTQPQASSINRFNFVTTIPSFTRNINSQTISLARHIASGIQISVGSLWWQRVKILAPVSESATVHHDRSVTVQFECQNWSV